MKGIQILFLLSVAGFAMPVSADSIFRSVDPLAARDEWGIMHQMPKVYPTDLERRRFHTRLTYNMQSGRSLIKDPAYVGALQTALNRNGYYCGEPDGIFSAEVVDAIMRLQKNYSMKVTGNLTIAVRRALRLP